MGRSILPPFLFLLLLLCNPYTFASKILNIGAHRTTLVPHRREPFGSFVACVSTGDFDRKDIWGCVVSCGDSFAPVPRSCYGL